MADTTQTLRQLTDADVIASLGNLRAKQPVKYAAFYSSQLGGIVTDPSLMVTPFDDHMVHRGHGIFDTAGLVDGKIYDLEAHLDRFHRSAEHSRLTMPVSRAALREIIIATVAASQQRNGAIRYWLSSGPGSLELSPAAGAEPGFFVMVFPGLSYPPRDSLRGWQSHRGRSPVTCALRPVQRQWDNLGSWSAPRLWSAPHPDSDPSGAQVEEPMLRTPTLIHQARKLRSNRSAAGLPRPGAGTRSWRGVG